MSQVQETAFRESLSIPIGFLIELSEATDQGEVLDSYARWVKLILGTDRATVAIAESDTTLRLLAIQGNQAIETGAQIPVNGTMIGRVFKTRVSEICHDLAAATSDGDCVKLAAGGLACCMDAALIFGNKCLGALAVGFKTPNSACEENLLVLESMARCLASYLVLHDQIRSLSDMALKDPLTKAFNRRHFQQIMAEAWVNWSERRAPLSLAVLDLDHFKRLNDTYGHEFGDEVLRHVADSMRGVARAEDVVVRMGGEEFCLVMPDTDAHHARLLAEALRAEIEKLDLSASGQPVPITTSVGVASLSDQLDSVRALTIAADEALYMSKGSGRNRVTAAM